jgi:hypothetical protein
MASFNVEVATCPARPVDFRIGCSGRNLKFPLDMHSISVGIVVQKRCVRRRPVRLRSAVEECAVQHRLEVKCQRIGEVNHHVGAADRRPPRSGIPALLAQNGVCDRDNHVRKSRSQCTDPDATHSRDDRGRDDGAHRDADTPKAIGITLIDTVRDQH